MPISARDDATLKRGLETWITALGWGGDPQPRVTSLRRPSAGWSNETVLVRVAWPGHTDEVVLRLPAPVPSFPVYDLAAQAMVHQSLAESGIPAPATIGLELDPRWLGAPFLVMALAPGRAVLEAPSLDPWVMDAAEHEQRGIQEAFIALLASVHRLDWRGSGLETTLRGADGDVSAEVRRWIDYIDWAAEGHPTPTLLELGQWCLSTVPGCGPAEVTLCWGDARLGNVLYDDERRVTAALDWELASLGPPEMDLGWYLALDELTTKVVGRTVPGFLPRESIVERYEHQLGRRVRHLRWHEIFALVRSAAISDRQARIAATLGAPYPGIAGEENPILGYIARRVERYEPGT